ELLGAGSFARGLRDRFPAGDAFGVHSAAETLLLELDKVTGLARTGNPYLDPTVTWDYQDSLTLLAPLRPDAPGSVAWRASIYRADMPLTAVWSPAPTQTVQISAPFAYVQDGAWDDFIADWYTTPLTPTIGEWCQYIPPVLVTGEVTETLALDAQPVGGNLELSFTETTFDDAAGYWLLVRRPHDVNWVVLATLPLGQTSYTTALPAPGETYLYSVVAQDALGVTLAQSNEVQVAGPGGSLYLPLVPGSRASVGAP
ncbi:MAG TPA: hypothetical protein VNK95_21320, partial [Caldilineaceae bacterium]|nr:hypothetical protein [Caldilineaceae bacterium]